MKQFILQILFIVSIPVFTHAQQITYSDPVKEYNLKGYSSTIHIVGKVGNNIVVFSNMYFGYAINTYDDRMQLKQLVRLDFMPTEVLTVDCIAYSNYFYIIYQYKSKGLLYCMDAKLDGEGTLLKGPDTIDSSRSNLFNQAKVYTIVSSEDKQHIMVLKSEKKNNSLNFETIFFDSSFNVVTKSSESIAYDDKREICDNFLLDDNSNFVFIKSLKSEDMRTISHLSFLTKGASADSFIEKNVPLAGKYITPAKLVIDNVNNRYIISSFYFENHNNHTAGVFSSIWNAAVDTNAINVFVPLNDSIKTIANTDMDVTIKNAMNDFLLRDVIVKNGGGFLLIAEGYSKHTKSMSNVLNRPGDSNPLIGTLINSVTEQYYYNNILVVSFDRNGAMQWSKVINKNQVDDDGEQYLSFTACITGGKIHYLFNQDRQLKDQSLTSRGLLNENIPSDYIPEHYYFMPRYGKQLDARRIVIPCTYLNGVCLALIKY